MKIFEITPAEASYILSALAIAVRDDTPGLLTVWDKQAFMEIAERLYPALDLDYTLHAYLDAIAGGRP